MSGYKVIKRRWRTKVIHVYKSKYKKVGVLPIQIVKSNVSSVGPSLERNRSANVRNVRLYYPYRQYTDLFIFRFVSEHCLRSTLRLFQTLLSILAVHQPFYISICISTLPTQHTTFNKRLVWVLIFSF